MIALVSVSADARRLDPVEGDPVRAREVVERVAGVVVVSCEEATHTVAQDDYLVDFGEGYDFPAESVVERVATLSLAGVGRVVASLDWREHDAPAPEPEPELLLVDVPDWDARVVRTVDQHEQVHAVRDFDEDLHRQADDLAAAAVREAAKDANRLALRAQIDTALAGNNAFVQRVEQVPEVARTGEQVYLLEVARQLNGILRWIAGRTDDVSDVL